MKKNSTISLGAAKLIEKDPEHQTVVFLDASQLGLFYEVRVKDATTYRELEEGELYKARFHIARSDKELDFTLAEATFFS